MAAFALSPSLFLSSLPLSLRPGSFSSALPLFPRVSLASTGARAHSAGERERERGKRDAPPPPLHRRSVRALALRLSLPCSFSFLITRAPHTYTHARAFLRCSLTMSLSVTFSRLLLHPLRVRYSRPKNHAPDVTPTTVNDFSLGQLSGRYYYTKQRNHVRCLSLSAFLLPACANGRDLKGRPGLKGERTIS